MKSTFKAYTLTLISLVSAIFVTTDIAIAQDRINSNQSIALSKPLGCSLIPNKKNQYRARFTNTTAQTIGSGEDVYIRIYSYFRRQQGGTAKYSLSKSLAPGKSIYTGEYVSDRLSASYTCKAYY
jgi:hypothetical protein